MIWPMAYWVQRQRIMLDCFCNWEASVTRGGWYRCSLTGNVYNFVFHWRNWYYPADYADEDTRDNGTSGVYIQDAQLEQGLGSNAIH